MATEPQANVRPVAVSVATVLFLMGLPVLYVLSIGPAKVPYENCGESMQHVLEVVYAPLTWLDTNSDAARSFFDWYCGPWCKRKGPTMVMPPARRTERESAGGRN